jgi:hypothetical protein
VEASFRGAHLEGARFSGATPKNGRLSGAVCTRAVFAGTTDLKAANFTRCILDDADLQQSSLTRANFEASSLDGANLRFAALTEANFRATRLVGADLRITEGAASADFRWSAWERARFDDEVTSVLVQRYAAPATAGSSRRVLELLLGYEELADLCLDCLHNRNELVGSITDDLHRRDAGHARETWNDFAMRVGSGLRRLVTFCESAQAFRPEEEVCQRLGKLQVARERVEKLLRDPPQRYSGLPGT